MLVVVCHEEVWHGEERRVHDPGCPREHNHSHLVLHERHQEHAHGVEQKSPHVHPFGSAINKHRYLHHYSQPLTEDLLRTPICLRPHKTLNDLSTRKLQVSTLHLKVIILYGF